MLLDCSERSDTDDNEGYKVQPFWLRESQTKEASRVFYSSVLRLTTGTESSTICLDLRFDTQNHRVSREEKTKQRSRVTRTVRVDGGPWQCRRWREPQVNVAHPRACRERDGDPAAASLIHLLQSNTRCALGDPHPTAPCFLLFCFSVQASRMQMARSFRRGMLGTNAVPFLHRAYRRAQQIVPFCHPRAYLRSRMSHRTPLRRRSGMQTTSWHRPSG